MPKDVELTKIWLYLARRDKTGMEILTVLKGRRQLAVRVKDLLVLNLPPSWYVEIQRKVEEKKMLWEPFVESAADFDTLRENLKKRGYTNLPVNGQPLFRWNVKPPEVNVNRLPEVKKMVQRGSVT
jgi:hypothetical protein